MAFKLGATSVARLKGVHPDLVKVIEHAADVSPVEFVVLEGRRTLARQKVLFAQGASRTLKSRHITGHAVDIAPVIEGKVRWDWPLYNRMAPYIKQAAKTVGVPIEWGGDWKSFKDGPHWQLPHSKYPA